MIYTGKVIPSVMEEPIQKDILQFFTEYKPQRVILPDHKDEQATLKRSKLLGFISGKMKALIRKNENLISRDCLILDLDDVVLSESELIEVIQQKFSKFNYVLYPSLRHGALGVRYRFVVPLDQSVNEVDYKLLIYFFSNKLLNGVINKVDVSNLTWSQLQLLPTMTQYVRSEQVIISKGDTDFPVAATLTGARKWIKDFKPDGGNSMSQRFLGNTAMKYGEVRYRNTTTELFESLVAGCEEGNRNNQIARITGGLLARAVNVTLAHELVLIANSYFSDPLPVNEVEATFFSIAKKELSQ